MQYIFTRHLVVYTQTPTYTIVVKPTVRSKLELNIRSNVCICVQRTYIYSTYHKVVIYILYLLLSILSINLENNCYEKITHLKEEKRRNLRNPTFGKLGCLSVKLCHLTLCRQGGYESHLVVHNRPVSFPNT
jgi:hypothetical protein